MQLFHRFVAVLVFFPLFLWAEETPALRLRIASANLTSGDKQSYDPGHGIRIFQAAKPDIIAIQEMNYKNNSPEAMREFVNESFGPNFYYYRESSDTKKYKIPNGIISKYPIVESGSWESPLMPDRGFAWAKIKLPNGESLWVVSVHLSSKSATNRKIEAEAIVKKIKETVPKEAYLVIGGDFNTKSNSEYCLQEFKSVTNEEHTPVDSDGKATTNANRSKRYDWVLASPSLDRHHVPVELEVAGAATNQKPLTFPEGLVFDTRKLSPLPPPAKPEDSGAKNMQHMLVIKDFLVPETTAHQKQEATH